jgi:quercetin dioxygenase-like cupin family protein
MIIRKMNEVQEIPVTQLVYKGETLTVEGVTIRWLTHKEVGDANYKHNFAVRYFTVKPNKIIPMHDHEYEEGVFILTGKLKILSGDEEAVVEAGDTLYIPSWEPHSFECISEEVATFICCIDCPGDKSNCLPGIKINK